MLVAKVQKDSQDLREITDLSDHRAMMELLVTLGRKVYLGMMVHKEALDTADQLVIADL